MIMSKYQKALELVESSAHFFGENIQNKEPSNYKNLRTCENLYTVRKEIIKKSISNYLRQAYVVNLDMNNCIPSYKRGILLEKAMYLQAHLDEFVSEFNALNLLYDDSKVCPYHNVELVVDDSIKVNYIRDCPVEDCKYIYHMPIFGGG